MELYIILAVVIICCCMTVLLCRRYVAKGYNSIDTVIERILAKEISEPLETVSDNRISKLTYKANRIIEMCILDVTQNKKEKEVIQGFISDMSHQMKTPLAGISMYSELLLEGNLSAEENEEFLNRIKSGTDKLQWMMNSLIKMSRLEVGAIQLTPTEGNIRQTILESINSVIAAASKKNIDILVSNFENYLLYHDRKWTSEAITNILENAIKYSSADSSIEIAVEQMALYTKIKITDHGIGVEKEDWNLIFKRFYRGNKVKEIEGTGLGLYLSSLIMEKQGGYIMIDSNPGEYTTFSLFLQNIKN
ncbi:MAG: HAMP domain-containing sensor histidine kinase [Mobilitalea sp.]